MTLRVTPWGKDDFKATSEEAESKDWAYWQNRQRKELSIKTLSQESLRHKNTQKIFKICLALLASQTSCRWKKC